MQTLELKIDENYLSTVLSILQNLKDGIIKDITIKNKISISETNADLEEFYRLIGKAKNPIQLNYLNATNMDDMIDDIF